MINIEAMVAASDALYEQGVRVFNAYLLAETEEAHARRLLELMRPPEGAVILDAGCGVGGLADLMRTIRPDLSFKLLNPSAHQLALCPPDMEQLQATYEQIPLPNESVDVVLFAFSLCHADDWARVLREAVRVLRPDGIVFIYDFGRATGDNTRLTRALHATANPPGQVLDLAKRCGLEALQPEIDCYGHRPIVHRLQELVPDDEVLAGVFPMTLRLKRMPWAPPVASAFARHERIAFQFSGGRDSMAAAWLLKPYWDRITFYHLDTGDQFPETRRAVEDFEALLGKPLVRIETDVHTVRLVHGAPSDVVPVDNSPIGRLVSGRTVKIQSRYECCARALMNPLHQRMLADGITLIVRGQRDEEYDAPPKRSGDVEGGVEVLYPIETWTAAQVDELLQKNQLPVAPFYARGMKRAPECMGCTAWWDEGRFGYLRDHHPEAYAAVKASMGLVMGEVDKQLQHLQLDDWLRG